MRRATIMLVGLALALTSCSSSGDSTSNNAGNSGASSAPLVNASQEVRGAVAKELSGFAKIKTQFEASNDKDGAATVTIEGPYNYPANTGNFSVLISGGSISRMITEVLSPSKVYVGGLEKELGTTWGSFPRQLVVGKGLLRTPQNTPKGVLQWANTATNLEQVEPSISVNGVEVAHYEGLISVPELQKTSDAATWQSYAKLFKALGKDARKIEIYIDKSGRIRRIYWGYMAGDTVNKTETNFTPLESAPKISNPSRGVKTIPATAVNAAFLP